MLIDPYRFNTVVADTYTVILLHCEEEPAIDYSSYARSISSSGGYDVQSDHVMFGAYGFLFSSGNITYADASEFAMGTGPFCYEGWFWPTNSGSRTFLGGQADSSGTNASVSFLVQRNADKTITATCYSGGTAIGNVTSTSTVEEGEYTHVAYVRDGNTFTLYINGTAEATATSASSVNDSVNDLSIGRLGAFSGDSFSGYVDEVRLSVGSLRYTANFTPTGPFPF